MHNVHAYFHLEYTCIDASVWKMDKFGGVALEEDERYPRHYIIKEAKGPGF